MKKSIEKWKTAKSYIYEHFQVHGKKLLNKMVPTTLKMANQNKIKFLKFFFGNSSAMAQ